MASISLMLKETEADKAPPATGNRSISGMLGQTKQAQAPAPAAPIHDPSQPFDFSTIEMLKSIPGSSKQAFVDTIAPVLHPIQTAKSFQALGIGLASLALGLDDPNEKVAKAVGNFYKSRYGTWSNFKKTVQEDPAGLALDVSAIFTAGGSAVTRTAGQVAKRTTGAVSRTAGQISKAGGKLTAAGQALDIPTELAQHGLRSAGNLLQNKVAPRVMASAAKFSPSKRNREKLYRAMLDEGFNPTPNGLQKMENIVNSIELRLDDLIGAADDRWGFVNVDDVLNEIDGVIAEATPIAGIGATDNLKKLRGFRDSFLDSLRDADGNIAPIVSVEKAQLSKQAAWKEANFALRGEKPSLVRNRAEKAVGRGFRKGIEKAVTEGPIADLNKRLGPLVEIEDEIVRSIGRQQNTNIAGGMSGLLAGTGTFAATQSTDSAILAALIAQSLGRGDVKGSIARGINQGGRFAGFLQDRFSTPEGLMAIQALRESQQVRDNDEITDNPFSAMLLEQIKRSKNSR